MVSNPAPKLTEEQYLAIERAAERKSEFANGEMFAMSGGSLRRARLQLNLYGELHAALGGGSCEVLTSDLRVRVSATRTYTYPDVTVVRGQPLLLDTHQDVLLNPAAILEVLSPSTQGYDRGLKFQHYRTVESLKEYILVSQDKMWIEQDTRQPEQT
jgi:Uma2 family endonuclease